MEKPLRRLPVVTNDRYVSMYCTKYSVGAHGRDASHISETAASAPSRPGPACEEWVWCECRLAGPHCQAMVRWDSAPVGCRLCDRCHADGLPSDRWCGCNCGGCRAKKQRVTQDPRGDVGCAQPSGSDASQPAPDWFVLEPLAGNEKDDDPETLAIFSRQFGLCQAIVVTQDPRGDVGCAHPSGSEASQPAPDWFVLEPVAGNKKDHDPETLAIFSRQFGLCDQRAAL